MNERIQELAKQIYGTAATEQEIRFAMLIVRECAKFMDENSGYDDANNAWHPEPEDMLKHFGVEE